jgi:hypothetical protein
MQFLCQLDKAMISNDSMYPQEKVCLINEQNMSYFKTNDL